MGRHKEYIRTTGIYEIKSIIKPERFYIGSAENIYKRWWYHTYRLGRNEHENSKLQNHYNKYGKNDLIFSVILSCEKSDLLSTEQFFLDSYKPYFNICTKAGSGAGHTPWNKGMKGQYHRTNGCFKKGNIP